jgi:CSLREA domain-containing protein
MSPSPFHRVRLNKLTFIAISIAFLAVALMWATGQQAGAAASSLRTGLSSAGVFATNNGWITPVAANIMVNSSSDVVNGTDGLCTLREAITAANTDTASGATLGECDAGSGDDTIAFTIPGGDPGCSGGACTITLTSGELLIDKNLTIVGPGANVLTVQRSAAIGTPDFRIINIPTGTINISRVTLTRGNSTSAGAGIAISGGTVTIDSVAITSNKTVGASGAGISIVAGTLNILNSLIANNTAESGGGAGIAARGSSTTTVVNSTISGNTAQNLGGGIANDGGPITLTNVTVTGNRSSINQGGGLGWAPPGLPKLDNTIIAGNFGGASPGTSPNDINALVSADSSFNLIGTGGSGGLSNGVNNNQVGVSNPRLGPLAENGGPTQTHALLSGSPALDAGSNTLAGNAGLTTDQRGSGFARVVDGPDADTTATVDIGAFEAQIFVEDIPDKSTSEDTQLQFTFNVGGTITSVTATSSNTGLVPNNAANLDVSGSGSSRTLTISPTANQFGSSTISVTVNAASGESMTDTFVLTVNAVAETPSVTNATTNEDVQSTLGLVISRNAADGAEVTHFKISNITNGALFKNNGATAINNGDFITFAEGNAGLKFTPAANLNSTSSTFSFQVQGATSSGGSGLSSGSATASITVNSVNDVPSFTKGVNQTVNEDSGAQNVSNWATAISAGPANESGQTLTFQVTGNTNAALFSVAPAISSTGTLTYTPAANANGSATITINLKDDGGIANGGVDTSASQTFTIAVNAVNDAPSFTKGADQTVNNNAGGQTVVNWATAIAAGPTNESSQTLTFQITSNTNSALFSAGPTVSPAGTLAYVPASNAGGTATITIRLQDNGGTANGGIDTSASQSFNITVIPAGGFINFSAATNNTTESSGFTTVTVKRTGDLTRAVTVDYTSSADNGLPCSTANGVATPKCDFTAALGTLSFAAGEDTKLVNILISQDGFVEGPETFTVSLSNPTNFAALGPTSTSTTTIADDASEPAPPTNVIDDARNFVRQHYHDFLNREPDQSGWDFWTNQITSCGSDVQCNEVRRIDVSASFFLSIEFQQNGYLVERFYKVGYGDATGTSQFQSNHQLPVPTVRFNEFLKDTQRIGQGVIVLQSGWEQVLESNKQAYALEFVQTTRFTTALPTTLTPTAFVDRLNQNAGGVLTLSERTTAINLFGGAGNSSNVTARAQAMRMVADDTDLYNAEFNRAFVLAQYFGYLRRNPNDAPETTMDYTG